MDSTSDVIAANASRSGYVPENLKCNIQSENIADKTVETISKDIVVHDDAEAIILSTSALVDIDGIETSADEIHKSLLNNNIFSNEQSQTHNDNIFYMIPRSDNPVNQYDNPKLLPALFPTLFPYGLGGPDNLNRKEKTSYKKHIQYLLSYHDKRFEKH